VQLEILGFILSCWWCRVGWTWEEKVADVRDVQMPEARAPEPNNATALRGLTLFLEEATLLYQIRIETR